MPRQQASIRVGQHATGVNIPTQLRLTHSTHAQVRLAVSLRSGVCLLTLYGKRHARWCEGSEDRRSH